MSAIVDEQHQLKKPTQVKEQDDSALQGAEPDLERKSLFITRFALILAIVIYFAYWPIDVRMLSPWEFELAWIYRGLVFIPATIFALVMTFRPSFRRHSQVYCLLGVVGMGLAMAIFTFHATSCVGCGAGGNVVIYSYPAIIIISVYSLFMLSMSFVFGLIGAWLSVIAYAVALIVSYRLNPQPEVSHYYLNAALQPVTLCALLSYGAFRLDYTFKRASRHMQMLRDSQERRVEWLENHASLVSHELKNAWLGISTTLHRIRSKETSDEVGGLLERADVAVADMKYLLQNVGDAVSEEAAFARAKKSNFDLVKFVRERLKQYEHIYPETKFEMHRSGLDSVVHGNQDSIGQLLDKLISNAVEHRESDSPIRILTSRRSKTVDISVVNWGSGLPSNPASLFDLRVSLRKKQHRSEDNQGFGLYIASRIAREHFGQIVAYEDEGEPDGQRKVVFQVTLPVAPTRRN